MLHQKIKIITVISLLSLLGLAAPAFANRKVSDLGDNAILAVCIQKQPEGVGSTDRAIRTDRTAVCYADVQIEERGNTSASARAAAQASARRMGVRGSIQTNLEAGRSNSYVSIIARRSWTASLNTYCQDTVSNGNYWWYRANKGRIFVAEGGFACHTDAK